MLLNITQNGFSSQDENQLQHQILLFKILMKVKDFFVDLIIFRNKIRLF